MKVTSELLPAETLTAYDLLSYFDIPNPIINNK